MYSVTIQVSSAPELSAVCKHLELLDVPAFLRTKPDAKAATPTAPAPAAASAPAPAAEAPKKEKPAKAAKPEKAAETAAPDGVVYKDVQEATFKLAGLPGNGPELTRAALAVFGVDHATKLKPEQWKPYVDEATTKYEENKAAPSLA